MEDGLVGRQKDEGNGKEGGERWVGAGKSEEEKEKENDSKEENWSQEEVSLEENEEECDEICSVCKDKSSVYRCDEFYNWLHETFTQSTHPFFCEY